MLCLHNVPAYQPSAEELLQQLEEAKPYIDRGSIWQAEGEGGNEKFASKHDEYAWGRGQWNWAAETWSATSTGKGT